MVMPDTPTIFLVGVVICCLAAALQWSLSGRLQRTALRLWAAANFAFGLGSLIYMLRPMAPDWLVGLVGNGLFLAGLALVDVGIDVFDGTRPRLREKVVVTLGALAAISVIGSLDYDREDLRVFIMAVAVSALTARAGTSLLRHSNRRARGIRIVCAVIMLAFAVFYLSRGTCILIGWLDPKDAASGLVGGVARISGLTMAMIWTVGSFVLSLDRLASTDELTDLSNRRALIDAGRLEVCEALVAKRPLSVLMVDLDNFKRVNDHFGHLAGDAVLQAFADTARRTVPSDGVIGRLGGEEFCVVLPGTDAVAATAVAERLRERCAAALGQAVHRPMTVTVSIGVATLGSTEASFADLVNRADAALYRAKARGRDRVVHVDRLPDAA